MNLLLLLRGNDASYMPGIKPCFSYFSQTFSTSTKFTTWTHFSIYAKQRNITHVAVTHIPHALLQLPLQGTDTDNIGHRWERDGISFVIIPPLEQVYTVPHAKFIMDMYFKKLARPNTFIYKDTFTWHHLHPAEFDDWYALFSRAILIAVDIETGPKENLIITSCAYTALLPDGRTKTCVISPDYNDPLPFIHMMRKFNALPVPKIMQNGRYDSSYFLRFGCPLVNYLFDTYHMMHCMYSELPRDLAFMSGLFLANFKYWKDESKTNLYEYNAKDTHNTLWLFLAQVNHLMRYATYATKNYKMLFPLVFPCISVGQEGIAVEEEKRQLLRQKEVDRMQAAERRLHTWIGEPWNPSSPVQTLALIKGLGYKKAESSDAKTLQAFAESHPLCGRLKEQIVEFREARKAISTYYDLEQLNGRLMYEQDPSGTDTGRLAAKKSNFWVGTQIQNIPAYCKGMFKADAGYHLAEVDNSQSESRCTAYISQDENLMQTVEHSPDFHCTNASLFFGIPFSELFDTQKHKVLRKDIRTVAKRINHGANYNMGAQVLWETMGTREVFNAARLLGLPRNYGPITICKYLLSCFNKAYPKIKGEWYQSVIREVLTTGKLVGATGWTRRTFLRPDKSKLHLNSCVAHPPQSLSVMLVNQAFYDVWKMQFLENQPLRLKAQIHDSIFFQYKIGREDIVQRVSDIMYSKDCVIHGRVMKIPNDPKGGATYWGDLKE